MKFEKFIERKFPGLNHLAISNETYLPGTIINDEDRIIDSLQNIFIKKPSSGWNIKTVESRINSETIAGSADLDFGAKILGVIRVQTGVKAKYSVSFEFNNASSIVFDSTKGAVYENDVKSLIRELKQKDKERWRDILHQYVVMEAIFVEEFCVQLKRNGKIVAGAEIEKFEDEISIDANYKWHISGELIIKDNKNPFGVRGFPVKRFM